MSRHACGDKMAERGTEADTDTGLQHAAAEHKASETQDTALGTVSKSALTLSVLK